METNGRRIKLFLDFWLRQVDGGWNPSTRGRRVLLEGKTVSLTFGHADACGLSSWICGSGSEEEFALKRECGPLTHCPSASGSRLGYLHSISDYLEPFNNQGSADVLHDVYVQSSTCQLDTCVPHKTVLFLLPSHGGPSRSIYPGHLRPFQEVCISVAGPRQDKYTFLVLT